MIFWYILEVSCFNSNVSTTPYVLLKVHVCQLILLDMAVIGAVVCGSVVALVGAASCVVVIEFCVVVGCKALTSRLISVFKSGNIYRVFVYINVIKYL